MTPGRKATLRKYYLAHREQELARGRKHRAAHPEMYRLAARRRREANPERERERQRVWIAANREHVRARTERWHRENPEKAKAKKAKWKKANPATVRAEEHRHRALVRSASGGGVTGAQWQSVLTESLGLCAYCNERRPLEMDHIEPLSKGGEHDVLNIAASCRPCNTSKNATPLLIWLARRAA